MPLLHNFNYFRIHQNFGNLKYDIDEILDEQINFYANLFSTEGWDKNVAEELVTHMNKKLTCDKSEDLEKDLTINEIKKIIFSMKQYKSPGLDGIINEFYQIYWDTIKEDLYEVLLEMLTLLNKGGDRDNIRNWRPITLLNSDY
jgi:hypothetical protein